MEFKIFQQPRMLLSPNYQCANSSFRYYFLVCTPDLEVVSAWPITMKALAAVWASLLFQAAISSGTLVGMLVSFGWPARPGLDFTIQEQLETFVPTFLVGSLPDIVTIAVYFRLRKRLASVMPSNAADNTQERDSDFGIFVGKSPLAKGGEASKSGEGNWSTQTQEPEDVSTTNISTGSDVSTLELQMGAPAERRKKLQANIKRIIVAWPEQLAAQDKARPGGAQQGMLEMKSQEENTEGTPTATRIKANASDLKKNELRRSTTEPSDEIITASMSPEDRLANATQPPETQSDNVDQLLRQDEALLSSIGYHTMFAFMERN